MNFGVYLVCFTASFLFFVALALGYSLVIVEEISKIRPFKKSTIAGLCILIFLASMVSAFLMYPLARMVV